MRKFFISLSALLLATVFCLAQNVPNGGFENWTNGEPDDWTTSNGVAKVITQSSDVFSGSLAVRGQTVEVNNDNVEVSLEAQGSGNGFPISERFNLLTFRYKLDNGNNDKLIVAISMRTETLTIGTGLLEIENKAEDWALASVQIDYTDPATPVQAFLQIFLVDGTGGDPPSKDAFFIIDDVELVSSTTAIESLDMSTNNLSIAPQPSNEVVDLTINSKNGIEDLTLLLFDMNGRKISEYQFGTIPSGQSTESIDVSGLADGVYLLRSERGNFSTRIMVNH